MITSNCPTCHTPNEIPEEYIGREVTCPSCNGDYLAARKTDNYKDYGGSGQGSVSPPPAVANYSSSNLNLPPRHSGWSMFLTVVGAINIFVVLFSLMNQQFMLAFMSLSGAITSFLFSFLVDVFTDIRWILFKSDARQQILAEFDK